MVYGELGRYSIYIDIKIRTVCYWARLLAMGIEIVPPFSNTVQPPASPRAIQKCFRVVQSQCPRVDT
jgi:hypothetical protein